MGETGHQGIPKEYLIGAGVFGILLVIVMITGGNSSSMVPIIEDIPKLNIKFDGSGGTDITGAGGGTSSVSSLIPGIDREKEGVNVYTNAKYSVNDIPETIALWHSDKHYHSNMYVENLRVEDGKVKFCIQNFGNSNGHLGHLEVQTKTWGVTAIDIYYDVTVPSGKKRCFETRSVPILEDGNIDPLEQIFLKISV